MRYWFLLFWVKIKSNDLVISNSYFLQSIKIRNHSTLRKSINYHLINDFPRPKQAIIGLFFLVCECCSCWYISPRVHLENIGTILRPTCHITYIFVSKSIIEGQGVWGKLYNVQHNNDNSCQPGLLLCINHKKEKN